MRNVAVAVSNDNQNLTPFETVDAIKAAGFLNVFIQWYDKDWECSQEEQLKYIRKLGLNVIFAHLGYQNINAIWEAGKVGDSLVLRYKKDIDICQQNNISLVVMHLTSKFVAPTYGETGLNRLREIVKFAKSRGVKIAFENTKIKGYVDYVIENMPDDNVGICFDSGHCHVHFKDDFNFELFKNRIFAVHLHDNDQTDDSHLLPFEGTIDWNELIDKLNGCNYDGPATLELCYQEQYLNLSPIEFYKKGYEAAEKLAGKLEI